MEALLWILLPGFVAVAAGVRAWFAMQSRMEVALANQRKSMSEARGTFEASMRGPVSVKYFLVFYVSHINADSPGVDGAPAARLFRAAGGSL